MVADAAQCCGRGVHAQRGSAETGLRIPSEWHSAFLPSGIAGDGCELRESVGIYVSEAARGNRTGREGRSRPDGDRDDEAVAFALATLRGSNIQVASVAEMPRIAESVRREFKI